MSGYCFVSLSDAGFYVGGSNAFGQLGTGKLGGHLTTPALCQVLCRKHSNDRQPSLHYLICLPSEHI